MRYKELKIFLMTAFVQVQEKGFDDDFVERVAHIVREYFYNKTEPRSYEHLKKYWKLCAKIASHCSEDFMLKIKDTLGFAGTLTAKSIHDILKLHAGITSIAFSQMTQKEFNDYYTDAMEFAAVAMIHCIPEQLEDILNEY